MQNCKAFSCFFKVCKYKRNFCLGPCFQNLSVLHHAHAYWSEQTVLNDMTRAAVLAYYIILGNPRTTQWLPQVCGVPREWGTRFASLWVCKDITPVLCQIFDNYSMNRTSVEVHALLARRFYLYFITCKHNLLSVLKNVNSKYIQEILTNYFDHIF